MVLWSVSLLLLYSQDGALALRRTTYACQPFTTMMDG
jgi:hypothetical protein